MSLGAQRFPNWLKPLGLVVLLLLLALAHTWPLARHLDEAIPYGLTPGPGYESVPMIPGDHMQFFYWCWLAGDNLLGPSRFPSNPYEFNSSVTPSGLAVYANFPLSLIFVAFSPLGPALAYNAMVLICYVLVGLCCLAWARQVLGHWLAALPAALLLTLMPFRAAQALSGHIYGFVIFLPPLALWCLERGWRARPGRAEAWGLAAGLALLAAALMENHLIYYSCLLLAVYAPTRLLLAGQDDRPQAEEGMAAGVVVGPLLAGLALGLCAQMALVRAGQAAFWSQGLTVSLVGHVLATSGLWLAGSWLAAALTSLSPAQAARAVARFFWPLGLAPLYAIQYALDIPHLGAGLMALLLAAGAWLSLPALWRARRWPGLRAGWQRPLWPLGLCLGGAVAFLLRMKATLMQGSIVDQGRGLDEVRLFSPRPADLLSADVPHSEQIVFLGLAFVLLWAAGFVMLLTRRPAKAQGAASAAALGALGLLALLLSFGPNLPQLPLYEFLYKYLPFFKYPRVPGRMILIAAMLLALPAGWALWRASLALGGRWAAPALGLACAALMGWSLWPTQHIGLCPLTPPGAVERAVAAQLPTGPDAAKRVLGLPIWPGDSHQSSAYEMLITRTRAVMPNGYAPYVPRAYLEQVYAPLYPLDFGLVDAGALAALAQQKIGGIVFYDDDMVYARKVSPFPPALARQRLEASGLVRLAAQEGNGFFYLPRAAARPDPAPGRVISPVISLWEANWLGRDTGRLVDDPAASGWGLLFAEGAGPLAPLGPRLAGAKGNVAKAEARRDKPGFLAHGPHKIFPPGEYLARFRLRRGPGASSAGAVEVAADGGKAILARRELLPEALPADGRWHDVALGFTLDGLRSLEFRVWFGGGADLELDVVLAGFAGATPGPAFYPAWQLWRQTGDLVADHRAPGGWAVEATPGLTPPLYLMHGPQQTYEPGRYRATFRLAASAQPAPPGRAALLVVAGDLGRRPLGHRAVEVAELTADYRDFAVEFRLPRRGEIGLRALLERGAGLRLAGAGVARLGD